MTPFEWFYYAAAGWYVAYVITNKPGPFGVFVRVRNWRGGRWHGRTIEAIEFPGLPGEPTIKMGERINSDGLLDCIICLLPWVALILRLIGRNVIFDAFAIAGVALMLHGYTGWRHNIS